MEPAPRPIKTYTSIYTVYMHSGSKNADIDVCMYSEGVSSAHANLNEPVPGCVVAVELDTAEQAKTTPCLCL